MHPSPPALTVDEVADLLATVAAANGRIATLEGLSKLTADRRPGAAARAVLCELDPDLLLAGTSVWLTCRRGARADSAAARAAARWGETSWPGAAGAGAVGA